ncbi:helix-turn-helix transcriptional regulator [Mucilaginibacter pallidiroseus]|uniref:Helix-turn-helix transcriptional regulator n=1 Tax=Mucilaginibacter pallidiroseus TaxID=2599295 RepID=A0A563UJ40_9SPHI|nr:AraC family transcriptional regulator [Mucilaginibacter pallidiroseus]TWR31298.1 helix-turn-helix transcriptional regulator [Mucilaginibacter pallidiroseus]
MPTTNSPNHSKHNLHQGVRKSFDKAPVTISKNRSELSVHKIWFKGIGVCCWTFDADEFKSLDFDSEKIEFVMGFVLSGNASINTGEWKATISKGKYYSCNSSAVTHQLSFQKPTTLLMMTFENSAIEKLHNESSQYSPVIFADGVAIEEYRFTAMGPVINEIAKAIKAKPVKRIYLEAKLLELLSLQLEKGAETDEEDLGFNETDIQRLHEAKLIVSQNLQTPCSLIELARKTGLNDFKLKKGFKALFGATVFGYLNNLRMEQAYKLLTNNATVGYVAEVVGYKNAQHFTVAFKKKYGILPSQVSKNKS